MNADRVVYRRILVALDGSEAAEKVLPHVETLAATFGAAVTLIGATESVDMVIAQTMPAQTGLAEPPSLVVDPTRVVDREHRETESYLSSIAKRLRLQGISVDFADPEGAPAEAILAAAQRLPADLIAMATHGRGGLSRFLFGSVADEVLRHAPCPMLIVRVDEEEKETIQDKALASVTAEEAKVLEPVGGGKT